jgi:hypothetical protein
MDGTVDQAPPFMEPSDLGPDDQRYDYTWMYIVLILAIVGVVVAVLMLRPKSPKPQNAMEPESFPDDGHVADPQNPGATDGDGKIDNLDEDSDA